MNVLIHVGTNTFFNSLFDLSVALKKKNVNCIFFFDNLYKGYLDDIKLLRENSFEYIVYKEYNYVNEPEKITFKKRIIRFIDYQIRSRKIFMLFFIIADIYRLKKKEKFIKSLIEKYKLSHLLMASDLVQYDTGLYIKIFKKKKLKNIVLPQFFANYKELSEHIYYSKKNQLSQWIYLTFRKISFLKKWIKEYKSKYLIRLPLKYIFVKEILRISPKDPWTINTGGADIVAVEGKAVKKFFLNEKSFNKDEIIVTGSISNDRLYKTLKKSVQLKNEMMDRFDLIHELPIALVAIPPDMHRSRKFICNFNTYDDLLNFWLKELKRLNMYNILLSIHPSVPESDYGFIRDYGFPIIDKPTVEFVPLADLFVASISATIQWAIACGIPVINYDVYRYDYDDYKAESGVLYTDKELEFCDLLEFFNNQENLRKITNIQKERSSEWAVLDGQSSERIYRLLNLPIN